MLFHFLLVERFYMGGLFYIPDMTERLGGSPGRLPGSAPAGVVCGSALESYGRQDRRGAGGSTLMTVFPVLRHY